VSEKVSKGIHTFGYFFLVIDVHFNTLDLEDAYMFIKYLAVDSDVGLAESEAAIWVRRGIGMDRAENMNRAIKKLLQNDTYLYVGINGDAVDFMPLLNIMRSTTNIPILIVTSQFSTCVEVEALAKGADLYARWHKSTEDNIASVLAHVKRKAERDKAPRTPPKIIVYKDLLLAPSHRRMFVGNTPLDLTRKEFDLLYYLMTNHDKALSYKQIHRRIWSDDYDDLARNLLWDTVKRLRGKLKAHSKFEYIETVWDFGYRFPNDFDE
jgi:DNA-binding response OmpR family regulator